MFSSQSHLKKGYTITEWFLTNNPLNKHKTCQKLTLAIITKITETAREAKYKFCPKLLIAYISHCFSIKLSFLPEILPSEINCPKFYPSNEICVRNFLFNVRYK